MSSMDNDTKQVKQEPSPASLEGSNPEPTMKDGEENVTPTDGHHDEKKHHLFGKKDKDKKGKLDINKAKADAEAEKNEKVRGVPAASPNTVAREQEKDRKEHPVQQPQKGEKRDKEEGEPDDGLTPEERIDKALKEVEATTNGLTAAEVKTRFDKYGPNALEEKHENKFWAFFKYAWNPLSWTMEIAAIIAIVLIDYVDFILILALLTLNSTIAYLEERGSGNAIAALKSQLAPTTKVLRDGEVQSTESANLVPGDIILLRLGDVIPADAVLLQGDTLKVDQSSLTGESLPSTKGPGDLIYCNAVIKQGEERAVVTKTGVNTFFGKAAALVRDAEESNHFQKVLRSIGFFCIGIIAFMVVMELAFAFGYHNNYCNGVGEVKCPSLNNILVIIVGGIPIAMPTVLSVTMAIGAGQLAAKQAIVSRLTAIEELAGMDVLCSDKTGTLTLNKLSVAEAKIYGGEATDQAKSEVLFNAALASKPENEDAIDIAMVKSLSDEQKKRLATYRQLLYHPFDPVGKKTFAKVKDANGKTYYAAKGAPQIILRESANKDQIKEAVDRDIAELAKGGYRSLGISTSEDGHSWTMTGIVPLFDPPRHDTQATIVKCGEMGVAVKMITGDQLAIAIETARLLGLGLNFHTTEKLDGLGEKELTDLLMSADGFAQVFPEHKYNIVHGIQQAGHTVGMTGDGVNDAPALKQADIGIAVHGATDAARAAADIVLLTPGLSVIIDAIIGSRKIFQRMRNYCMYSLSVTVRIALTFGLLTIIWDFFFPPIAIVILAIVNDGTIMTISKDRVKPSQEPDHWDLKEIFIIAIALGMWLSASTLILFWLAHDTTFFQRNFGLATLGDDTIRGLIYLQVSLSGLATIFVTRAHRFSWMERPGNLVLIAFILAQIIASILGAYGLDGYPFGPFAWRGSGWGYVLVAWVWCIIWFIPMDFIKLGIRAIVRGGRGKRKNKKIASASRPGSQPATPGMSKGKTPMGTPKANPGNAAVPNGDRQAMRPQPTMAQSRPDARDPGKMPREEMRSPTMRNRMQMQQMPVQGQSQPSLL